MSGHKQVQIRFADKTNELLSNLPSYVRSYIRSIHNRTSARTNYEYLKDIQMFLNYIKDRKELSEVTLSDLDQISKDTFEDYFEYLEHYESDRGEVTNGRCSLARKLATLRSFFRYLYTNEMISCYEVSKISRPKVPKKPIIKMDKDEASDFLSAVHGHRAMTQKEREYYEIQSVRDLAIVYLMLSSGIRVSECSELDVDDVDIKVDDDGYISKACLYITRKGGNEAVVYFSDEAAYYLQAYIIWRNSQENIPENEKALFLSSRKQRLSVRSIEYLVKKYAASSLPGKHITPHKLRATFATQLYEETGDIYLVAGALGHTGVSTTTNHYANLSDTRKQENRNVVKFDRNSA